MLAAPGFPKKRTLGFKFFEGHYKLTATNRVRPVGSWNTINSLSHVHKKRREPIRLILLKI
jgi:hypothetical protein